MELYGHSFEDIWQQASVEMLQSAGACNNKRSQFQVRERLYNDQTKPLEKITANVIYSQVRTLIALGYNDQVDITFCGRGYEDASTADKWTKLAKFDYDEMDLDIRNFACTLDKLMYGVGIKMFEEFDKEIKAPKIKTMNAMNMLPDPKGWLTSENYRRVTFLNRITKREAKEMGFEEVDKLVQKTSSTEKGDNNWYNNIYQGADLTPDGYYDIQDHFFTSPLDGQKYLATFSNQLTVLHRFIKLEDMMGRNVRPFSFFFFSPQRNNPYGMSIPDLSEDKQRKISKLLNLAVARATRSSLGPDRLYAKDLINNRNDLVNLTPEPKLIGIDTNKGAIPLAAAMMEVPTSQVPNDNPNTIQQLQYFNSLATGIDPQTVGIQTPGAMTKAESQTLQANANLLFSLTNSINFWGEKDFWRKRVYLYQNNFTGKKIIRLTNQIGTNYIEISKKDLSIKFDLDVQIESASEYKAKNDEEYVKFGAMMPYYTSQGGYAALYATRKLSILGGVDYDESFVLVPKTPAEEEAYLQLEMLNRNMDLELPTDIMAEHDTYITIYRQSMDTPAKWKAINARTIMKIQKDKFMAQQGAMMQGQSAQGQGMAQVGQSQSGTVQNAMTNNALQNSDKIVSTQQVAQ